MRRRWSTPGAPPVDAWRATRRQRAHGEGAGRAEERMLAVGIDDHLRRDQPAGGPEHGCRQGPQDPIEWPHRNRHGLGRTDCGAADGAHDDEARGVGSVADGAGSDDEADGEAHRRRPDPTDSIGGIDPADADLYGAEHSTTDQSADGRRTGSVDIAGNRSGRHPRQREPDKGPEPPGPSLDCCPVRPHRCLLSTIWASSGARRRHRERRR